MSEVELKEYLEKLIDYNEKLTVERFKASSAALKLQEVIYNREHERLKTDVDSLKKFRDNLLGKIAIITIGSSAVIAVCVALIIKALSKG